MRRKIGNDEFSIRKQDKAAWLAAYNSVRQRRSQEFSGVFGAISRDFKISPVSFALSSFKISCYAVLKHFFEFETQKGKRKWLKNIQKRCQREASECPMSNGKCARKCPNRLGIVTQVISFVTPLIFSLNGRSLIVRKSF